MSSLHKQVAKIPGEDGWWKSSSQETFESVATTLVEKGFTEEESIDILQSCYWAVSACYGN